MVSHRRRHQDIKIKDNVNVTSHCITQPSIGIDSTFLIHELAVDDVAAADVYGRCVLVATVTATADDCI